jgi:hypothetical protein
VTRRWAERQGRVGVRETGGVFGAAPEPLTCSARGCRARAAWALRWNNPRLHSPERRKTWLACETHRDELERFLGMRGFLRDVVAPHELGGDELGGELGEGTR